MLNWFKTALIVPIFVFVLVQPSASVTGETRGLNPRPMSILRQLENRFHRNVIVTSGCRSFSHNRRIGGARESWHLRCMAADVKIVGVDKTNLAKIAKNIGGCGGLGTYCHDSSVHIDLGPRRNWYWGCAGQRSFNQGKFHRSTQRRHSNYKRLKRHRKRLH